MKLYLKLITNKRVPIEIDFNKNTDPTSSTLTVYEHSEQMLECEFCVFRNSDLPQFKENLKRVIKKNYPNITKIEGLQELDNLIEVS